MLTPLFGSLLFLCLYFLAASFYPGGSQANTSSKGFSWLHNYWCNLLNEYAINGQPNRARPVAFVGSFVLAITLSFFFYIFPKEAGIKKPRATVIQITGILSMMFVTLLFTPFHDAVINVSGVLGLVALLYIFITLYNTHRRKLFWFGMFNLLLIALNNYVYHTNSFMFYLPVIQKISFLSFLVWVCLINLHFYLQPIKAD